jgi:hypothetical protein
MAEDGPLTAGLTPGDKLAVALACLAGIMAILLWFFERTPATVIGFLVLMLGLAARGRSD